MTTTVARTAVLSACGHYRYELRRQWSDGPVCGWIMLNPSTADAERDDPTVRQCITFAQAWGFGGIVVRNLYALRATDPRELWCHDRPIGPGNDRRLLDAVGDAITICAWGTHGIRRGRGDEIRRLLTRHGARLYCLSLTKRDAPGHPLYLPGHLTPRPFEPGRRAHYTRSTIHKGR